MINAYAALAVGEKLKPYQYENIALHNDLVEVKVSYCGICHSDIGLIDNNWSISEYPLVPGHEIVGIVTAKAPQVTNLDIGQRVGIGWQCSACLHCEWCLTGQENVCSNQTATATGHHGGFADTVYAQSRFVFPLPDGLDSAQTAPLFCGGVTVFSPLWHHQVNPTLRVGVIGIGGLGHLGLQFAHAFGCEVTAISHSPEKEEQAKLFGAHHFLSSRDPQNLHNAVGYFDFILSTVDVELNWENYINLLRPKGTFCVVGAAPKIDFPAFSLIRPRPG